MEQPQHRPEQQQTAQQPRRHSLPDLARKVATEKLDNLFNQAGLWPVEQLAWPAITHCWSWRISLRL
jgi:hypothetical protein